MWFERNREFNNGSRNLLKTGDFHRFGSGCWTFGLAEQFNCGIGFLKRGHLKK